MREGKKRKKMRKFTESETWARSQMLKRRKISAVSTMFSILLLLRRHKNVFSRFEEAQTKQNSVTILTCWMDELSFP